jgi:hypothetical protein
MQCMYVTRYDHIATYARTETGVKASPYTMQGEVSLQQSPDKTSNPTCSEFMHMQRQL